MSKTKTKPKDQTKDQAKDQVKVTFLGGLGEIGRNCACVEVEGKIMLIDCGIMFPELDMLGIDLVLPDFTYLRENADRIIGCIATHGHEDHVGGLNFLLRELSFPIYGSALTLGLARNRIEEAGLLDRTEFIAVQDGERRRIGPFDIEFIPVTHSVPHGMATAFHTPQGVILHTGDFKLDLTPVDGRLTDLARIGSISSNEGIRLLLSDSTNAEEHGHAASETTVGAVLYDLFHRYEGRRIITTCFASHIHRVQQIADAAISFDRVIATMGMSMKKNVRMAREMGLLNIPESRLMDIADVGDMAPEKVCIISTGSQGEPMSALSLMAANENRWINLSDRDVVIMSSHPIPGNETDVSKVINGLVRMGAEVVHSGISDVHASGHAKSEDLKMFLSIARPEYFVPVHGEYRHLAAHAKLARQMGVAAKNILLCTDGDQIVLDAEGMRPHAQVPAGYLYVDGILGDVGTGVLRDRRVLADEGVVVVIVAVNVETGEMILGPEIITRGWIHAPEAEDLLDECAKRVRESIADLFRNGATDIENIQRVVRRTAGRFVSDKTKRRPMIVPVVMEA
ncbi:COG0595 mRNA degradation ribonucleases J1/J2 (metallo-beta-lactamase superfamily) [Acidimicrobiia bacterium]